MTNYISQHYQWIFSGIGVLFLTIIYNLILKKSPKKVIKKNEDNRVIIRDNSNSSLHIGDNVINNYNVEEEKKRESGNNNTSNFEATVISEIIRKTPPFQKKQTASNYKGIRIKWEVSLRSIHALEGNVARVMSLYQNDYPWVIFNIDIEKHPIFKVANSGKDFIIIGKILKTDGAMFEIDLVDIVEK